MVRKVVTPPSTSRPGVEPASRTLNRRSIIGRSPTRLALRVASGVLVHGAGFPRSTGLVHGGGDQVEMGVPMDETEAVIPGAGGDQDIRGRDRDSAVAKGASAAAGQRPDLRCSGNGAEVLFEVAYQAPFLRA